MLSPWINLRHVRVIRVTPVVIHLLSQVKPLLSPFSSCRLRRLSTHCDTVITRSVFSMIIHLDKHPTLHLSTGWDIGRLCVTYGHVAQQHRTGVAPIIAATTRERHGFCDHRQLHCLFISLVRLSVDSPQCFPSVMFHVRTRAGSRLAPSQWETSLQSNAVSHWLGANLESALRTSSYVLAELGILAGTDPLCQITEEPMMWLCVD